jgi:acetyltransferase-like isoleucine patch superfamily enzyme
LFKEKLKIFIGFFLFKIKRILIASQNAYQNYYYYKQIPMIGKNCKFNGISFISGLDKINMGNNIHIGNNAFIRAEGGLTIGDNVHFARNTVLYTMNHNYEGTALPYNSDFRYRPVIIDKNVWIGINVTILPGSHIKEGAIIGAGSVVFGTVDKGAIMGNKSLSLIKTRDMNHYKKLDSRQQYGGANGKPYKG